MTTVSDRSAERESKPVSAACADNMCGNCWSDECGHTCHADAAEPVHLVSLNPTLTRCGLIIAAPNATTLQTTKIPIVADCEACQRDHAASPSAYEARTTVLPEQRAQATALYAIAGGLADGMPEIHAVTLGGMRLDPITVQVIGSDGGNVDRWADRLDNSAEVVTREDGWGVGKQRYGRRVRIGDALIEFWCVVPIPDPAEALRAENEALRARLAELEAPAVETDPDALDQLAVAATDPGEVTDAADEDIMAWLARRGPISERAGLCRWCSVGIDVESCTCDPACEWKGCGALLRAAMPDEGVDYNADGDPATWPPDPCPVGDPDCETGDDGSCHDGCEAPDATSGSGLRV